MLSLKINKPQPSSIPMPKLKRKVVLSLAFITMQAKCMSKDVYVVVNPVIVPYFLS